MFFFGIAALRLYSMKGPVSRFNNVTRKTSEWFFYYQTEVLARRCSIKKMFLEISQNSQENTCARVSFLIKLRATLLKKRLWHRCFPLNFAKFLRTLFLTEHLRWLLLYQTLDEEKMIYGEKVKQFKLKPYHD